MVLVATEQNRAEQILLEQKSAHHQRLLQARLGSSVQDSYGSVREGLYAPPLVFFELWDLPMHWEHLPCVSRLMPILSVMSSRTTKDLGCACVLGGGNGFVSSIRWTPSWAD